MFSEIIVSFEENSTASYIEDVLLERTYQKWGYEQVLQSHITGTDFPIGVK